MAKSERSHQLGQRAVDLQGVADRDGALCTNTAGLQAVTSASARPSDGQAMVKGWSRDGQGMVKG
eukprot:4394202-Prymnesium_polylepis.1